MKTPTKVNELVAQHETRNPFEIANSLGIHVLRPHLIDVRGFYMQESSVDIIFVASNLKERPAKFVCAHELGHCLLHKGMNRLFMDKYTYMIPDKYEDEADYFAAQLLFSEPPETIDDCLNDCQLADCLNVPVCNVNARMVELGICF